MANHDPLGELEKLLVRLATVLFTLTAITNIEAREVHALFSDLHDGRGLLWAVSFVFALPIALRLRR